MTLVAFDFDGTLSDSEMTVLLGEQFDRSSGPTADGSVAARMDEITRRAMNDEIEYAESLRRRCALLEGLPIKRADEAFGRVELRPGAADVLRVFDEAGIYTAVLTGGFERGVAAALDAAGASVDTVVANRLPSADGALTGEVEGPLVEGTKDEALAELATAEGVPMVESVAVGDGANDRPMLQVAGIAVGYAPKSAVEPDCDETVDSMARLGELFERRGLV